MEPEAILRKKITRMPSKRQGWTFRGRTIKMGSWKEKMQKGKALSVGVGVTQAFGWTSLGWEKEKE